MAGGYLDTFSIIFGWWYSSPVNYRYYELGTFYVDQEDDQTYYVAQSKSYTQYIHTDGVIE